MVNAKYCSITVMLFSTCHLDGVQCGRISLYTYVVENDSELLHMAEPGAESTSKYVPAMENSFQFLFNLYARSNANEMQNDNFSDAFNVELFVFVLFHLHGKC